MTSPARATVPGRSTRMPAGLRVAPQQRGQHGPGPAADIDDGADGFPAVAELDVEVGDAVPGRSHERVEFRRDRRVGGQVLPEGLAEHLLVGGLAGADVVEQRPPGVGHPAADAVEIEERPSRELFGGRLQANRPGDSSVKTPLATR